MLKDIVSGEQLETLVTSDDIVFIDFWAEWCAPCKEFGKVYARVAEQYPAIQFTQINVESAPALAEAFQIRSIPHLIVFKQGIIIYSESGNMPESALKELTEQALTVDMTEIRTKMEEERQSK
ncbi:thioredoxin [Legionella taurinensis]|uniref:Thioredoxin n=1 Tax=Legionella taurinensis TaxID=70611 RepID=A0A3A5L9E6_9GAMM|nr:thioredoxin family protein [Legionella taurinensis]MDX1838237.1 thioredoxin family protein [Legionella taurinensis]PUT39271.1 thiol reductase thioredoxin [Legionella taurinensis]PUT40617.1 thiol reductase thioredoxin [Legionella taurinensis]PUT44037.1 thiol reductase thioredoxin [Legionella taurinensis]PUT46299.1 thiol reductase thioredoxin [Legionella taurinensis]